MQLALREDESASAQCIPGGWRFVFILVLCFWLLVDLRNGAFRRMTISNDQRNWLSASCSYLLALRFFGPGSEFVQGQVFPWPALLANPVARGRRILVGLSAPSLASQMYISLIHERGPCRHGIICRELNLKNSRG
jgi:hypothetical protein